MREPSIHITLSAFREIFIEQWNKDTLIPLQDAPMLDDFLKGFFREAKKKACNTRAIYMDDKSQKRAEKIISIDGQETLLFQTLYIKVRQSMGHRGIKSIKPGDKDWANLKLLATQATSFCERFSLEPKEGYTIFLKIAFQLNPKPFLNKLITLDEKIAQYYDAELEIDQDPHADLTYKAYELYIQLIIERVGTNPDYYQSPIYYLPFTQIPPIVKSKGGNIKDYITAQFEELAWTGTYPEPNQLIGDKAVTRYVKYCYKNQIRLRRNG